MAHLVRLVDETTTGEKSSQPTVSFQAQWLVASIFPVTVSPVVQVGGLDAPFEQFDEANWNCTLDVPKPSVPCHNKELKVTPFA